MREIVETLKYIALEWACRFTGHRWLNLPNDFDHAPYRVDRICLRCLTREVMTRGLPDGPP